MITEAEVRREAGRLRVDPMLGARRSNATGSAT